MTGWKSFKLKHLSPKTWAPATHCRFPPPLSPPCSSHPHSRFLKIILQHCPTIIYWKQLSSFPHLPLLLSWVQLGRKIHLVTHQTHWGSPQSSSHAGWSGCGLAEWFCLQKKYFLVFLFIWTLERFFNLGKVFFTLERFVISHHPTLSLVDQ